ncbi:phosphoenolpyruvate carboxykinase [Mycolicibacterium moriokaense]|jgi:pyruvate,water dikinase|nr:phosphoenolpyruvate carboxykinase [Mycolicibacterium moriokaense]ORB19686.1 phosphoenolpyruvate carboxykinase [Mycolicibacterium moriokaense]
MFESLDTTDSRPGQTWTTGNVAEAFPGVFTTFGLEFVFTAMEMAFRRMFRDLGVYTSKELTIPDRAEDCFWAVFDGWAAGNIDKFRDIANRMPGTTASAVEQQLFGFVRPETVDQNTFRRYPAVLAKAPRWLITTPKRHDAMFAELRRWRLEKLSHIAEMDERACLATIADAQARFEDIMSTHMGVAMVSSSLAEKVAAIADAAGRPGLEAALLSGVGSDENEVAHDLWALAHDQITLREFTDRHGYHGPNEGQLSGVTWREDPTPVLARLDDYRAIAADSPRAPRARSAAQAATRAAALRELLAETPRLKRPVVAAVVKLAARYLALREQGKAGYLLTFDVARAAARRAGTLLVERGVIEQAEDVFHLRYQALAAGIRTDQRALVQARAAEYRARQSLRLPKSWSGMPEIVRTCDEDRTPLEAGEVLTGVAASGGVTQGRARVVRDPDAVDLDDGDILVCETTDPAWVPLFLVAGAVVTDHGGLLSHGPIVAREIGIPCVCGTEVGSRRITEGQLIRVDGDRGTVEVLESCPSVAP